jgi:hypothetical protein
MIYFPQITLELFTLIIFGNTKEAAPYVSFFIPFLWQIIPVSAFSKNSPIT